MTPEEKKLQDRAKRLWKNYRITLERYEQIFAVQNGCCAICGRHQSTFTRPLQVDHYHFKVVAIRATNGWAASTTLQDGTIIYTTHKTKAKAEEDCRDLALPLSVRGLLCPGRYMGCNRLLGRVDRPQWLENAHTYLLDPPAKKC